jgi:hypothetical protein
MGLVIFPRNSNTAELRGVKSRRTGAYINDATVTWEVRTEKYPDGDVIDDGSGVYITSSNGDYEIDLDSSLNITAGNKYVLRVMAETNDGEVDVEDFFVAKERTGRTATT